MAVRIGACSEAVERPVAEQADDEATKGRPQPRDARHRRRKRDAGAREVVGLHPDPGAREGFAPVLFDVAAPAMKIDCGGGDKLPAHRVIEAQDTVIALHEGDEAIPVDDARRAPRHGPRRDVALASRPISC